MSLNTQKNLLFINENPRKILSQSPKFTMLWSFKERWQP
jgi:hypothetical protein